MYSHYYHPSPSYPYVFHPYQNQSYSPHNPYVEYDRYYARQPVRGQASWTDGGAITQCGIPWSTNRYMTVAVGRNSPYQCGQTIKVKNLSNGREILVTVVDQVPTYPENKISLHRRAFETLGANVDVGIINVEIVAAPQLEEEKWGKYLLEIVQSAYPNYQATDYSTISKTPQNNNQMKEIYEFRMQSPQETIRIQGTVVYNPNTDRITSINFQEV
ncbi:rare lipoprotein A [Halobacillus karajensis]|uniref:Rare lipoprotein A (RlpA)-like double-psi beta-barrel n=1 Tax=Halobacillus karajensis TaxID=195088 RepID=A0A024P8A4_9BACI|nr:DUF3889 domain-containing protein [Halobacillus karajensis]CDQ20975.1 Rare lipoprotein A (RlpA)-like double-psi beta-barrel [Halobacillus karajensis]CDQ24961.1 Rare lipoprotein A (RlpA)-like double-psi beta-barrel [Halobacillus karajensis]CDQ28678.1 Rare lipoprotein A (RlpA)-like double-psi beta-barrel [Halobacillus karajensis]SEH97787.1 rare lipoprotein A [Halobacillus karajensis]